VPAALVRTSRFLADYREIALRIGNENPEAVERICDALEQSLDLLTQHPQIGCLAGFSSAPQVRRWVLQPFPNYIIYCEAHSGEVLLVRLLHGARDVQAVFRHERH
jgi:toxin ParE1/3/4